VLLTCLREGQVATVLQLPAEPKTAVEVEAQRRGRVRWLTLTFAFNSMITRAEACSPSAAASAVLTPS
jgi:hypothetical protein